MTELILQKTYAQGKCGFVHQLFFILDSKCNLTWKTWFQIQLNTEKLKFSYLCLWITGTVKYIKNNSDALRTINFKIPTTHPRHSVHQIRHKSFKSATTQKYQNWLEKHACKAFSLFHSSFPYHFGIWLASVPDPCMLATIALDWEGSVAGDLVNQTVVMESSSLKVFKTWQKKATAHFIQSWQQSCFKWQSGLKDLHKSW